MKTQLFAFLCMIITSCNTVQPGFKAEPQTTVEGALRESWRNNLYWATQRSNDVYAFWDDHRDEILNSLVVADKYISAKGDFCLILYRYSVGEASARKSQWFRKIDGNWYPSNKYINDYADDPLRDGNGEQVKKWLKKADQWTEENASTVWW